MNKPHVVNSAYAKTYLENGVIFQIMDLSVTTVTLEIAKQLVKDRIEATHNANYSLPVLAQVNNAINISKKAREYYATGVSYRNLSASAVLLDNYVMRLTLNLLNLFSKPPIPIASFKNKEKALLWLEQYKIEKQN